jgi:hypothetical protein
MHLDDNLLVALAAHVTDSQAWRDAQPHLDTCPSCRAALAGAAKAISQRAQSLSGTALEQPTQPSDRSASPRGLSLVGATFAGRYRIDAELGRGGMGIVYRAWDERLSRSVALKVASRPAEAQYRERLLREARAMASISHPRVVAVHDTGEHDGQLYVAMELIDGVTLDRLISERRPRARELLRLGAQVAEGLAAIHAAGLVHRDVKPANVMIDRAGNAKVMDLGLVRQGAEPHAPAHGAGPLSTASSQTAETKEHVRATPSGTRLGAVLGTVGYMAPEQLRGENVGPAADQFSFCVTLYECLARRRPFDTSDFEAWQSGAATPAPALVKARGLPSHVSRVIARGLERDPAKRYADLPALMAALEHRPHRRAYVLGSLAAVAGVVAAGAWWGQGALATRECQVRGRRVEQVWNPAVRARVRGAVLGSSRTYPVEQLDRALLELDERAARWSERAETLCRDERAGKLAAQAASAERTCLDELLGSLRGLAGAFEKASPSTSLALASSVKDLHTVASCAARRPDALGSDAWSSEARARIAEHLARARMGQLTEAVDGLGAVAHEAAGRGARAIQVSAELSRTGVLLRASRHDERTVAEVKAAVRLAEAEGLDELVFVGRRQLAELYGRWLRDAATANEVTQDARAALERLGSPPAEAGSLALVEAWNLSAADDMRGALLKIDEAERLCATECAPELRAAIPAARASMWAQVDPGEKGVTETRRATELIERLYGPESVELFSPLVQQCKVAVTAEAFEEAVRSCDRALALAAKYQLEPSGLLALALSLRGMSHHELTHPELSRADLDAAEALYEGLPGVDPFARIVNLSYLALLDAEEHRPQARARATSALELAKLRGEGEVVALPTLVLGLALGDTREGREHFESGRKVFAAVEDASTLRWIDKERDRIWKR